MNGIKKKYWIQYTKEKSFLEAVIVIKWFDFLENRDILLKAVLRSGRYRDVRFGEKIFSESDWYTTPKEIIYEV